MERMNAGLLVDMKRGKYFSEAFMDHLTPEKRGSIPNKGDAAGSLMQFYEAVVAVAVASPFGQRVQQAILH